MQVHELVQGITEDNAVCSKIYFALGKTQTFMFPSAQQIIHANDFMDFMVSVEYRTKESKTFVKTKTC